VNSARKLGEVDFGPDALIDLDAYTLAFLDEHVRGNQARPRARAGADLRDGRERVARRAGLATARRAFHRLSPVQRRPRQQPVSATAGWLRAAVDR